MQLPKLETMNFKYKNTPSWAFPAHISSFPRMCFGAEWIDGDGCDGEDVDAYGDDEQEE